MSVLSRMELHRRGVGVLAPRGTERRGSAIWVELPGGGSPLRTCNCPECKSRGKTCDNLRELSEVLRQHQQAYADHSWQSTFEASVWFRLAKLAYAGAALASADVRVQQVERLDDGAAAIRVLDPKGREVAQYLDTSPAYVAFLERTGKAPRGGDGGFLDRAGMLQRLALFQLSENERTLEKKGFKTRRLAWEESFWHRLAYHCVREFGDPTSPGGVRGSFHPAVDKTSGDFTFTYRLDPRRPVVKLTAPRRRVEAILDLLRDLYPDQEDLAIHPVPLRSLFRVTQETELDLRVGPVIRLLQESGETRYLDPERLEKYRYGNLVYVRELGILAQLEKEKKGRSFRAPVSMKLARSQVPGFLDDHVEALEEGALVLDEPLRGLEIWKHYDAVSVEGEEDPSKRSWFWVSVRYRFGDDTVALEELLGAKKRGLPYFETPGGWVDLGAPAFRDLGRFVGRVEVRPGGGEGVRLSAGELLRFEASTEQPLEVAGPSDRVSVLRRLLDHQPVEPYRKPRGLRSELRPYQVIGTDWLRFLAEHGLGGLLCDDMGLGKTHQAMALMACLVAEAPEAAGPFLVVCPTSVVSHWRDKLGAFAPGLRGRVYHGADRHLPSPVGPKTVVITSYGILRNDAPLLSRTPWRAAFFDEVQQLKNRSTVAYGAAERLPVAVKIGLTGTPIENSIDELKALFDLTLPGYLGDDRDFRERYDRALETEGAGLRENRRRLEELRRLIRPFVMRRRKSTVLDELPEKIEDLRSCPLSEEQAALYRRLIDTQGAELRKQVGDEAAPLPYLHVFALLNQLKQICDHPALASGDLDVERHRSGKWDLYCELLRESLDGGQKVVVFSQYLGMLEILSRHLDSLGVDHVRLVGATPMDERGRIVDRFNRDDRCRVFLGSLKAGGTGIDLVGGSVVIHYDRWWNAAREDQATDRVHRMGQKRAVQVFKLVTEGTLEEKIAAIIERKRDLLDAVVEEDDHRLSKIFSRQELLEMLQQV